MDESATNRSRGLSGKERSTRRGFGADATALARRGAGTARASATKSIVGGGEGLRPEKKRGGGKHGRPRRRWGRSGPPVHPARARARGLVGSAAARRPAGPRRGLLLHRGPSLVHHRRRLIDLCDEPLLCEMNFWVTAPSRLSRLSALPVTSRDAGTDASGRCANERASERSSVPPLRSATWCSL